jgi:titin
VFVVTTSYPYGSGSIEEAIRAANQNAGFDEIQFNIGGGGPVHIDPVYPGQTIAAPIMGSLLIDGTTQPGYSGSPLVTITVGGFGIIQGSNVTIKGLNLFGGADIYAPSYTSTPDGQRVPLTNIQVLENVLGMDLDGNPFLYGGRVMLESVNSRIEGNVLRHLSLSGSYGTVVRHNKFNTDPSGTRLCQSGSGAIFFQRGEVEDKPISPIIIGGTTEYDRNIIAGAVYITDTANNIQVMGNYIGTDVSGTVGLDTGFTGILIHNGAYNVTIGGTTLGSRNVISGNMTGISILDNGPGVAIQGNYIGTDRTGLRAIPNTIGIGIGQRYSTVPVTIGGTTAATRNVISGNRESGVSLGQFSDDGIRIWGNLIGTDRTGLVALGNGVGVDYSGEGGVLGGTEAGSRNVISGNVGAGVLVRGVRNVVQGNFIGTNQGGTAALPNRGGGVRVEGGSESTIGGTTSAARNVISGNLGHGVFLGFTRGTVVQGNRIGTRLNGTTPLGNSGDGVHIEGMPFQRDSGLLIGGATSGAANTIAYSGGHGISVSVLRKNVLSRNVIFANAGRAIALLNNGNDSRPAPNLLTAAYNPATLKTTITGRMTDVAGATFTIELFSDVALDPDGRSEARRFRKSVRVTTNASGVATFSIIVANLLVGEYVTATATDAEGNTSELSLPLQVG